jgi:hypothetical protein
MWSLIAVLVKIIGYNTVIQILHYSFRTIVHVFIS